MSEGCEGCNDKEEEVYSISLSGRGNCNNCDCSVGNGSHIRGAVPVLLPVRPPSAVDGRGASKRGGISSRGGDGGVYIEGV